MTKSAWLMALFAAFALAAFAQEPSSGSDQGTNSSMSQPAPGQTDASGASAKKSKRHSGAGKEHQLTGCVSGPNSENAYLLTNGRRKKGIEIGGNDDLKNHIGHQVKLTGTWVKSGAEVGESDAAEKNEAAEKKKSGEGEKDEASEKHFKVTNITMISETCPAAVQLKRARRAKAAVTAEHRPATK